jgi:hypothetical protein
MYVLLGFRVSFVSQQKCRSFFSPRRAFRCSRAAKRDVTLCVQTVYLSVLQIDNYSSTISYDVAEDVSLPLFQNTRKHNGKNGLMITAFRAFSFRWMIIHEYLSRTIVTNNYYAGLLRQKQPHGLTKQLRESKLQYDYFPERFQRH